MIKQRSIRFGVEDEFIKKVDELADKLELNRNEMIRLALDDAIGKYLHPGHKGNIMAVYTKQLDELLKSLYHRIEELDPKIRAQRRAKEAREIGEKVYDLHKVGKHGEAKRLVNESVKKGIYPTYAYWPEAKEKLTPEGRKAMLKERYPDSPEVWDK